jgi:hypothetical protein
VASQDLPVPELSRNMLLIGHTDQGGRPDGMQLMVHHGYAYAGHMFSKGFSVIDVTDPTKLGRPPFDVELTQPERNPARNRTTRARRRRDR